MKCSVTLERHQHCGNINMKTLNNNKNPYKKESELNIIVDQLCIKLQDIKDQEAPELHMQNHSPEQSDAVRKYCAAFPALKKGEHSPLQYYMPPPAWCRKIVHDTNNINMQCDLSPSKDWNSKKKYTPGKERRNSYHGQRKHNKKRCHSYSRSFESKESLPEWVTHEGVWDMESQDPVREFIRAIALDEGYGTCENTVTEEVKEITQANLKMKASVVPDWDDSLDLEAEWIIKEDLKPQVRTPMEEELYAKFEAKFDRSIEALWSKDQANTPDDECQELPIDFQDLLSSPSDYQFYEPAAEKSSLVSLSESIWSNEAFDKFLGLNSNNTFQTPSESVDILHDRFKPLNLTDDVNALESKPLLPAQDLEPFSLYNYEGVYDAMPCMANIMQSLTTLNHSKEHSSFTEVLPRKRRDKKSSGDCKVADLKPREVEVEQEDLLISLKTHFRPIRAEAETVEVALHYANGTTFEIQSDFNPINFRRSESGYLYLESETELESKRYLEYRDGMGIDYGRLNLTEAQKEANKDLAEGCGFQLKFAVTHSDKCVQTDGEEDTNTAVEAMWSRCDECNRLSGAKKMRSSGMDSIWSTEGWCGTCAARAALGGGEEEEEERVPPPAADELSAEWEELVSDISAAHAQYAAEARYWRPDRKRRHSAALRCHKLNGLCSHPHAPFLHCCALDRPLTR